MASDAERTARFPTPPALTAVASRFEVMGTLGQGGMGVVYQALDRHTGDLVALKVLHPSIALDPDGMDRFRQELAAGGAPDARSDVYSLGLVMYEMFSGRQAFTAETPAALVAMQINNDVLPPRELDPDVPARIERAVLKCLEKNPDRRFQSVL